MREKTKSRERWSDSLGREGSQDIVSGKLLKKDFREGLVSIFVDNLCPSIDSVGLWRFFKPLGKVRDVFLSSKKSFRGSCFGFIRFETVEEATIVAKKVNGMVAFGRQLSAKVASYGWKRRWPLMPKPRIDCSFKDGKKGVRSFAEVVSSPWQPMLMKNQRMLSEENRDGSRRQDVFSSRQAGGEESGFLKKLVGGDEKRKKQIVTMEWFENDQEWLKKSAVGILHNFSDVSSVNDRLSCKGIKFSSAYIGDKCILWSFESEDEKEGFIKNRFLWDDCFSSVVNWSDSLIPQSRLVWIYVSGIPLRFWNHKFFMSLGWMIGEPLLVDKETETRVRFDFGRILVLIPIHHPCPNEIKVISGGGSFVVKIEEDGKRIDSSWLAKILGLQNKCERDQGVHMVDLAKAGFVSIKDYGFKEDKAPSCFNPSQEEVENQDSFQKGNSREKKTFIEIDESSMELCSEENAREGCGKSVKDKGNGLGNRELNGASFNSKKGVGDNPPLSVVSVRRSSGCGKLELVPRKDLRCSVVNPREGCSGRVWDQTDNVNLLQLRSEDDRVGGGSSLGDDGLVSDVEGLEATARKESSKCFMKLDKGYEVSELSISDKARDSCHFFSKKKSMVDSKVIAKLSCENRGVLANGDLIDGKGLLLNSNFLRCDSVLLSGKGESDNEKLSLTSGLITVPVKWGNNVETVKNSKRRKGRDYCLAVKGHDMKLRSSKNCFIMSGKLEEEIFKVIDYGISVGYDFKVKKVKMADIIAKVIAKLMGIKAKMAKDQ